MERLELPTVRLEGGCSIQLSYMDTDHILPFFILYFNYLLGNDHQFSRFLRSLFRRRKALKTTMISILPRNMPMMAVQRMTGEAL